MIDAAASLDAMVTYAGSGSVGIDAASIDLPASYDAERSIRFTIPPGRRVLRIYYTFDDGSLTDRRPLGPYATFRLTAVNADGSAAGPLTAGTPARWQRAGAVALDVIVFLVSLGLAVYWARLVRAHTRATRSSPARSPRPGSRSGCSSSRSRWQRRGSPGRCCRRC